MENINNLANSNELYPQSVTVQTEDGNVSVAVGNEFRKEAPDSPLFRIHTIYRQEDGKLQFRFQTQKPDGSWEAEDVEGRADEEFFKKFYLKLKKKN